jgi:arylsulfatase A-like enzyme
MFAKRLKQFLLAGVFAGIIGRGEAPRAERRPNILHIVVDDLGWRDTGFNGAEDLRTPSMDRLAGEGAVLGQFYTQAMCTPTRACLMTGRYPFRYGLQTAVIPSVSSYGLDLEEALLPQVLKDANYATAIIGKWHLGHADQKYWPKQRGFDYQYGAMIGELDYFTHSEHGVLDWFRNNEPLVEEGYTTNLIGDEAVRYIGRQGPEKPFYLYLAFNAPHTPYQAPEEYISKFAHIEDPTRRIYAAMIACLDDNIAKVVAALDAQGLRDNTLIVFHSDNGGTFNPMFAGVMADMSKVKIPCDNRPLRDGKGSLYEGGNRVVAFANWPGRVQPGRVDGMMHAVDLFTTFAHLAGASTEKCKPLDGLNVWATLSAGAPSPRTELVYGIEPFRAGIRQGDFKLVWRTTLPSQVELFDLSSDPREQTNIAVGHPDVVLRLQNRANELSAGAARPLFLVDQFKVIMRNMQGEPVLPGENGFGDPDSLAPAAGH